MTIENTIDMINGLQDYPLRNETEYLIKKYAWELRFHQDDTLIPLSEIEKVNKIVIKNFTEDFLWVGAIPYMSFANLLGLRDLIMKSDEDSMLGIIAPPGTGKSTFALACARFLDRNFSNDYVIFDMQQLQKFLQKATRVFNQIVEARKQGIETENPLAGRVVVLDEGVYLLFSGDSQTKEGKLAQKIFSVIRALNLIFLVNITNWRKISKGVKEDRFKAAWRLPVKGIVKFMSQKRITKIEMNKDKLQFPKPNFYENTGYIDPGCSFWRGYNAKKSEFLIVATHDK